MKLCRAVMIVAILVVMGLAARAALAAPLPVAILVVVVLAAKRRRARSLDVCGTSAWATYDDLAAAGMVGGNGLSVGRIPAPRPSVAAAVTGLLDWRAGSSEACARVAALLLARPADRLVDVRLNGAVHTAVFAPTGAGKGVSQVVPFLLDSIESCAVIDPKGENARLTADRRRRMGHRVVLLDPFGVDATGGHDPPDTFNPLDAIARDSPLLIDDCRALASALVVRTGEEKDPHWNDSAELWITAMLAATCLFAEGPNRSLQGVRTLLTDPARTQAMVALMCASDACGGMLARLGRQLTRYVDKELSSTMTSTNRHLNFLDTLAVAANTRASSFDPAGLRAGRMTVFLILPPEFLRSQAALLRLWVGAMLRACVRGGLGEERRVHFILDEAASLGRLEVLEDAVDKLRGYGVRLQFYYQSAGQLRQVWKDGLDQSLLSNTTQVFYGVNDYQTAQAVSDRLGEHTVVVDSGGTNAGGSSTANSQDAGGSYGRSWGSNTGWAQQARRLLKPEEVIALPPRVAVTFAPGVPPVAAMLTRYYERPAGRGERRWASGRLGAWLAATVLVALAALGVWAAVTVTRYPVRRAAIPRPAKGGATDVDGEVQRNPGRNGVRDGGGGGAARRPGAGRAGQRPVQR